jgi:hypothetical protein
VPDSIVLVVEDFDDTRALRTVRQQQQTWDILQRQLSTQIQEPVPDIFRA